MWELEPLCHRGQEEKEGQATRDGPSHVEVQAGHVCGDTDRSMFLIDGGAGVNTMEC